MGLFFVSFFFAMAAFAQVEILDLDFDLGARHVKNSENNRERSQGRVRVGFTIGLDGAFELVGIASTGPNFDSSWASVTDTRGSTEGRHVVFRNLYLRRAFGDVSVEAGALRPEPTVGGAGQDPGGWFDGVRVQVKKDFGHIKVVAGSLGDFDQPNAFKRKFSANFIEVELEEDVFEDVLSQTGIQNYNGDYYLRQNIRSKLQIIGDKILTVFAGALVDFKRGAVTAEIGADIDVLDSIMNKYKGRLNLRVFYSHIDERMPDRDGMLSTFNTFGHQFSLHVGGKIDKSGKLNWYYRSSIGDRKRQDAGITLRIPLK